ncbi:FecR family protein [Rubritalea squalenifaciens DSM 18772]|uniref:FecR family protein n=1 Tax=Rubritalea squalenifaciens DSM 18772 TaxID=1123071 RepID=A0A1M6D810_9BACT|nr:FecR domain-containing protein [Rubritalea squalenifaciens]SHI69355.1 FecR family protein [Rubritalea squalenifaciens DSM 18772]
MSDDRFESLLSGLIDQELSQEEFNELQNLLAESEANRQAYWDFIEMHSSMEIMMEKRDAGKITQFISRGEQLLKLQARRTKILAACGAAAVAMITAVTLKFIMVEPDQNLASFETAPDTRYSITNATDGQVDHIQTGDVVSISQGTMELKFKQGVRAIITGPAEFTLVNDSLLDLEQGSAWFHVPQEAVGFTVETPEMEVVDLGTKFAVKQIPESTPEVHVFTGKVRVTSKSAPDNGMELTEGNALKLNRRGQLEPIKLNSEAFLTELTETLPYLYWSFDSKDGFQAKGSHSALTNLHTNPVNGAEIDKGYLELNGNKQFLQTNWKGFAGTRPRSATFLLNLQEAPGDSGNPGILAWGSEKHPLGRWKVAVQHSDQADGYRIRITFGAYRLISYESLKLDQWYQIAVGFDGIDEEFNTPRVKLYVDGQEAALKPNKRKIKETNKLGTVTDSATSKSLRIGSTINSAEANSFYIHGKIDDLCIFDGYLPPAKALKQAEEIRRRNQEEK